MTGRILLGLIGITLAATSVSAQQERMAVVPYDEAKLIPIDPALPDSTRIAVLSGNPAKGPSSMLMKMVRGTGRLHVHSADYRLVIVAGEMKHRSPDQSEAVAPIMGPGSYWAQPGGQPHADSCLSDTCLMYIEWSGPRDSRAVN